MVSVKYSRKKANPKPPITPTTMARSRFNLTLGLKGIIGSMALSIILILLDDTPTIDSISLVRSSRLW